VSACATGASGPGGVPGAPAAPAAVERFLEYARARDYNSMGWIFGTSGGAIIQRDPVPEVEQRMYALASILQHDSYSLAEGQTVPGRTGDAMTFDVTLRRGARDYRVPFTAVRGPGSRWFVENLDVEAITAP
jgi:hypothetical protein